MNQRCWRRLCLVALAAASGCGEQPGNSKPAAISDPSETWARIRNEVQGRGASDIDSLIAELTSLTDRSDELPPLDLARALTALGDLALRTRDSERAGAAFQRVLQLPSLSRDLSARATYGRAQAAEIAGDSRAAIRLLEEVGRAHPGTRYARFAESSLHRLRTVATASPDRHAAVGRLWVPWL